MVGVVQRFDLAVFTLFHDDADRDDSCQGDQAQDWMGCNQRKEAPDQQEAERLLGPEYEASQYQRDDDHLDHCHREDEGDDSEDEPGQFSFDPKRVERATAIYSVPSAMRSNSRSNSSGVWLVVGSITDPNPDT